MVSFGRLQFIEQPTNFSQIGLRRFRGEGLHHEAERRTLEDLVDQVADHAGCVFSRLAAAR